MAKRLKVERFTPLSDGKSSEFINLIENEEVKGRYERMCQEICVKNYNEVDSTTLITRHLTNDYFPIEEESEADSKQVHWGDFDLTPTVKDIEVYNNKMVIKDLIKTMLEGIKIDKLSYKSMDQFVKDNHSEFKHLNKACPLRVVILNKFLRTIGINPPTILNQLDQYFDMMTELIHRIKTKERLIIEKDCFRFNLIENNNITGFCRVLSQMLNHQVGDRVIGEYQWVMQDLKPGFLTRLRDDIEFKSRKNQQERKTILSELNNSLLTKQKETLMLKEEILKITNSIRQNETKE
jgi:hypothetical protein